MLPNDDFFGDGSSGVLFNDISQLVDWEIKNGHLVGTGYLGAYGYGFVEVGTGDFYNDGFSDVLFFNPSTDAGSADDEVFVYTVEYGNQTAGYSIGHVDAGWTPAGLHNGFNGAATQDIGDFYGNGNSDILFQNEFTGGIAIWEISDGKILKTSYVGTEAYNFRVAGVGDLYGNGTSDVIFQDTTHGIWDWKISDGEAVGGSFLGTMDANWFFAGTGDFYGDGTDSLLFQNVSTGGVAIWKILDGAVVSKNYIGTEAAGYTVVGTGYYHGLGAGGSNTSDILFQGPSGNIVDWRIQNGSVVSGENFGVVSPPGPGMEGWQAS